MPESETGVMEVRITGVLTLEAFYALRPQIFQATRHAPAIVARIDTAVDILFEAPQIDISAYRKHAPPQAVVVDRGQYLLWLKVAENLRAIGVRRAIFPTEHLAEAIQWAEMVARDRLAQARTEDVGSGPAPLC